jgi:hypothetical protein
MHDAELMLGCVRWLLCSQNTPWRSGDGSAKRRSIRRRCVGIESIERTIQGYCGSDSQQQLRKGSATLANETLQSLQLSRRQRMHGFSRNSLTSNRYFPGA